MAARHKFREKLLVTGAISRIREYTIAATLMFALWDPLPPKCAFRLFPLAELYAMLGTGTASPGANFHSPPSMYDPSGKSYATFDHASSAPSQPRAS